MRRFACLLLVSLALPASCLAGEVAVDAPVAAAAGGCKAKSDAAPAVAASAPTDAPARSGEAPAARPASATAPATTRSSATPRWNRLLPGMFR